VFRVEEAPNDAARVVWGGTSSLSAGDIHKEPVHSDQRSALSEAKDFLSKDLADGRVAAELVEKDARAAGISKRTLMRAKSALGVKSDKESDGSWSWLLLEEETQGGQVATAGTLGTVGILGKDANHRQLEPAYLREVSQGGRESKGNHEPRCVHGYAGGSGCYLCDPRHPHRLEQAERCNGEAVTQHRDIP
jgi:hypothetical protein